MYYSCTLKASLRQKLLTLVLLVLSFIFLSAVFRMPMTPIPSSHGLTPLTTSKKGYEVFGFAPYWTLDKLQNVDFTVLTTLSYFSLDIGSDGSIDTTSPGYTSFESPEATALFKKAHSNGTRVVLTITQMDSQAITSFLDDQNAQRKAIASVVSLVKERGIDGINTDFEYVGDPGGDYPRKYSDFVKNLTTAMHNDVPESRVTVSVLATSVKDPTLYNVGPLSKNSDGIFLMAYDFATLTSDTAMPTSPLYGYKSGKYWYDVSTAVTDFLTQMPAQKLILGVPWYSYNYAVYQPGADAATLPSYYWNASPQVQTYATASSDASDMQGWDADGKVGWKAYYDAYSGAWRMVYVDNPKSLGLKYDFAKNQHLAGVGMWALGFDDGTNDMWSLLRDKFGAKIADNAVLDRSIQQ